LVSTMSPWLLASAIWSWRGLATTWSSRATEPYICYFGHLGLSLFLVWLSNLWACICLASAWYMQWIISLGFVVWWHVAEGKEDLLGVLCLVSCRIKLGYLFTE
jgi:hypothetical protein